MTQKIKVTQKKSLISEPQSMRRVLKGLGLGRIGKSNLLVDNNCIRGMINKAKHLVSYEIVKG